MSLHLLLIILACAASVSLFIRFKSRLFPVVALVASGLQALAAYEILQVHSGIVSLPLLFGAAIAVAGIVVWASDKDRLNVTAATILILVGGLQVFQALGSF